MFFKECESLANKNPDLRSVCSAVDDYFYRNPTAVIDVEKLNNFLKLDIVGLENVLEHLATVGVLTSSVAFICGDCGGYNEQEVHNDAIPVCLHCDRQLFASMGKTLLYGLNDEHRKELAHTVKPKRLVLFIHGLGGSPKGTWQDFPALLKKEDRINERFSIECFAYPTSWKRRLLWFVKGNPDIAILADDLRTNIDNRYVDYDSLHLICHSLGA